MILTIKVIIIIGTLHNGWTPLSNIKKSSPSDAARALYMPLKRFFYHVTWWIGVDDAPSIPCLELSPTRITVTAMLIKITIIIIIIIIITVVAKQ